MPFYRVSLDLLNPVRGWKLFALLRGDILIEDFGSTEPRKGMERLENYDCGDRICDQNVVQYL